MKSSKCILETKVGGGGESRTSLSSIGGKGSEIEKKVKLHCSKT